MGNETVGDPVVAYRSANEELEELMTGAIEGKCSPDYAAKMARKINADVRRKEWTGIAG